MCTLVVSLRQVPGIDYAPSWFLSSAFSLAGRDLDW